MTTKGHHSLDVWQKAMDIVTDIYKLTKAFPKEELYGLTSQMRRAAVSIPSNIAEGRARRSTKDYLRFIVMARGSVAELETQMQIGVNLAYASAEETETIQNDVTRVGRMLSGLISTLEDKLNGANAPAPSL